MMFINILILKCKIHSLYNIKNLLKGKNIGNIILSSLPTNIIYNHDPNCCRFS